LASIRVGWLADRGFGPVEADTIAVIEAAAAALSRSGCKVEAAHIPILEHVDGNVLSATLFGAEAIPYLRQAARGREHDLHATTRRMIETPIASTAEYIAAELEVERLRDALSAYFAEYDAMLCPVAPRAAHAHGVADLTIDGRTVPNRNIVRCAVLFDLTGAPALSVPFGWSRERLPIGVQIVGRHFDETTVLRLGLALEDLRAGGLNRPIL
jgi:aspartyl-tRNA(Asn)/glutamyl-tRNA(Gln) amidotransferase subunit A